jgi:spore maturation protein A
MIMSRIWTGILAVSMLCSISNRCSRALAASVLQGAQAGITLAVSIAGSLGLWTGVGRLMDAAGITDILSKWLQPVLQRLFPGTVTDPELRRSVSSNLCANILGLGNAATPMGIRAAKAMNRNGTATDELCMLVVLNTASIQLIPANVAAVRSALGSTSPFDILPAVWITSLCSAGMGLAAAWSLGKVWKP